MRRCQALLLTILLRAGGPGRAHQPGRAPRIGLGTLALFLFLCGTLAAGELPQPLREASELYRLGRLDDARHLALSVQRAFPRDLEALLLLCRIDTAARRYPEAKTWIRLASAISPRHPLVTAYRRLFDELEYRQGPLSSEFLPLPGPDRTVTADRFKKGWFGPNILYLEPRTPPATSGSILSPLLSRQPLDAPIDTDLFGSGARLGAGRELRAVQGDGALVEDVLARQAGDALANRMFLKAYLLFTRLLHRHPNNQGLVLGKARACIGIGRYREAASLLDPYVSQERIVEPPFTQTEIDDLYRQAKAGPDLRRRLPPEPVPHREGGP